MLDNFLVAFHQTVEASSQGGLKEIFRQRVFWKRKATPTVMDLTSTTSTNMPHVDSEIKFVELQIDEILSGMLRFSVPSRYFKARRNLMRNLRGFAILKENVVMGDIWCAVPKEDSALVIHPDLEMLGVNCESGDVYAFDAFIDRKYRGNNLALPLQRFLHLTVKSEGYKKVYGFYWDDNLPALWMHRMLRYQELPKRSVTRFFFIQHATYIEQMHGVVG